MRSYTLNGYQSSLSVSQPTHGMGRTVLSTESSYYADYADYESAGVVTEAFYL